MSGVMATRADFFAGRGKDARWIGSTTPTYESSVLRGSFLLADPDPEAAADGSPYIVTDFLDEVEAILEGHAEEWKDFPGSVHLWLPGGAERPVSPDPDGTVWTYCFDAGAVYVHLNGWLVEVLYPNGSRKKADLPDVTKESNAPRPAAG